MHIFASKESGTSTGSQNEKDTRDYVINSQKDNILGALGCHLGMVVASILVEVSMMETLTYCIPNLQFGCIHS